MQALAKKLKDNNENFEFYPTSAVILRHIARDIHRTGDKHHSVLDVGAGNGNALTVLEGFLKEMDEGSGITKYAIEKSKINIQHMPKDIFIVGTDFHVQTLIDKDVDITFCNPPYKEYAQWMEHIIRESKSKVLYFVVPQRWSDNKSIQAEITRRNKAENAVTVLTTFDFMNSEYIKARAKVDVLKIELETGDSRYHREKTDPFKIWFDESFKINADKKDHSSDFDCTETKRKKIKELVKGQNIIERLEELYIEDMAKLMLSYKAIEKLDSDLLRELNIDLNNVMEALKMKIQGLKNLYWNELFDNLDTLTNRLTSNSRKSLLGELSKHTSIDFTSGNAYAIVIWAIKNSNSYFDSQLLEVYKKLSSPECVHNYKSNKNFVTDKWMFNQSKVTHYTLDYRIVTEHWKCFNPDRYGDYDYHNGLHNNVHTFLGDICTVASNLGFEIRSGSREYNWELGRKVTIWCFKNGKELKFMDVRAYKNGNAHLKINQEFMLAFNVEAARLNGWIKNETELERETGIKVVDSKKVIGTNHKVKNLKLLN